MKSREDIENSFNIIHRSEDGIQSPGDLYFKVNVLDNQNILLEVLLDIRDLLNKYLNK